MSQIEHNLNLIQSAVYGEQVRGAIIASIEECYEDVSTAKTLADSATADANTAAENANLAASQVSSAVASANTAAQHAETASSNANEKAILADQAASNADTKAGLANTAAGVANTAASNADTKAGLANTAAANANAAATNANEKANLANTAAGAANTATANANAAATNANDATELVNAAVDNANTAATNADSKASLANTAAENANAVIIDLQDMVEGKSAYQVWLNAGNTGTQEDFLLSLVGADGQNGSQIVSSVFSGDDIVFTFSDDSTVTLANAATVLKGEKGSIGVHIGPEAPTEPGDTMWVDTGDNFPIKWSEIAEKPTLRLYRLINAGFQVWQRGDSFPVTTSLKYTADRWMAYSTIDGVCTISKHVNGLQLTGSSTQKQVTLRYKDELPLSYFIGKTLTIKVSINGVVYKYQGILTLGKLFSFNLDTNEWTQSASGSGALIQLRHEASSAIDVVINWVDVNFSDVDTEFIYRSYAEELASCQRYYTLFPLILSPYIPTATPNLISMPVMWPTPMRVAPSVIIKDQGGNTGYVTRAVSGVSQTHESPVTLGITPELVNVASNGTASANQIRFSLTADAEIY